MPTIQSNRIAAIDKPWKLVAIPAYDFVACLLEPFFPHDASECVPS
jgi:hypothetical protein